MTNKIISPYDVIGYINSFLPRPIHPISILIKQYINMHNNTINITDPLQSFTNKIPWRDSFSFYIKQLRHMNIMFNRRKNYFHTYPSFGLNLVVYLIV
jgi:hypothetical protein